MDATDVFSKITYLEEGMKKLLAQKAVSSEELQQLLAAIEAKANPTIKFDVEAMSKQLAPMLIAKMPALDVIAVVRQLGPLLLEGLPTPATLRQAGDETAAKLNHEFSLQEQRMRTPVAQLGKWLATIEQRVEKLVDGIPRTVGLDAFYDYKVLFVFFGLPTAFVVASICFALIMRVPREEYERVAASNEKMTDIGAFYFAQINEYKRKFPKSVGYFQDYHSAPPAQPMEPVAP